MLVNRKALQLQKVSSNRFDAKWYAVQVCDREFRRLAPRRDILRNNDPMEILAG